MVYVYFRTTYQDHWFDNFGNAIVGHLFAQILVPLDNQAISDIININYFFLRKEIYIGRS